MVLIGFRLNCSIRLCFYSIPEVDLLRTIRYILQNRVCFAVFRPLIPTLYEQLSVLQDQFPVQPDRRIQEDIVDVQTGLDRPAKGYVVSHRHVEGP